MKERDEKKFVIIPFFVVTNFPKLKIFFFLNAEENYLSQFSVLNRFFVKEIMHVIE
jgi:hypothetical protein